MQSQYREHIAVIFETISGEHFASIQHWYSLHVTERGPLPHNRSELVLFRRDNWIFGSFVIILKLSFSIICRMLSHNWCS